MHGQIIMKKILLMLLMTIGFIVNSSAQNACSVYGAGGATATVTQKGGQADGNGVLYVPVSVSNYKTGSSEGRYIDIWIEVRDQDTRCVVKRAKANVWIKAHYWDGTGNVRVSGLEPYHDYLYNIDSAKTCE